MKLLSAEAFKEGRLVSYTPQGEPVSSICENVYAAGSARPRLGEAGAASESRTIPSSTSGHAEDESCLIC